VKNWSFGTNCFHHSGGVLLEEAPWYIFAIREGSLWVCEHIPSIPLPRIPMKDSDGEDTTLRDCFGELNQLWHFYVDMPLYGWADSKVKTTWVETGYDAARELFLKGNEEYFREDEEIAEELKNEEETE
jgi:hypothetical protein